MFGKQGCSQNLALCGFLKRFFFCVHVGVKTGWSARASWKLQYGIYRSVNQLLLSKMDIWKRRSTFRRGIWACIIPVCVSRIRKLAYAYVIVAKFCVYSVSLRTEMLYPKTFAKKKKKRKVPCCFINSWVCQHHSNISAVLHKQTNKQKNRLSIFKRLQIVCF